MYGLILENPSLFGPTMQFWVIAAQDHRFFIKRHVVISQLLGQDRAGPEEAKL